LNKIIKLVSLYCQQGGRNWSDGVVEGWRFGVMEMWRIEETGRMEGVEGRKGLEGWR